METEEQRYTLPLQVAFQVPLPLASWFCTTFDNTFASGAQPVYPALTVFSRVWTAGEFTDTQPLVPAIAMVSQTHGVDLSIVSALIKRTRSEVMLIMLLSGQPRRGHATSAQDTAARACRAAHST
jgi:hypothetical protein